MNTRAGYTYIVHPCKIGGGLLRATECTDTGRIHGWSAVRRRHVSRQPMGRGPGGHCTREAPQSVIIGVGTFPMLMSRHLPAHCQRETPTLRNTWHRAPCMNRTACSTSRPTNGVHGAACASAPGAASLVPQNRRCRQGTRQAKLPVVGALQSLFGGLASFSSQRLPWVENLGLRMISAKPGALAPQLWTIAQ